MPEIYKVAVIGSTGRGNYGHGLDTAWAAIEKTKVVAVADDNADGLASAQKRLKVDRGFADYRQMIEQAKPDIVAIGPRWIDQHRDMVVAAAESGCHVYMEKPFCRDLVEADQIVAACESNKVKLAMALPTRYSPLIGTIRRLIDSGDLGKVLEYRGRGKEDRRGGGEDLWVLGTHVMDMIRSIGSHPTWCFAQVAQDGEPVTKKHVANGAEGIGPLAGNGLTAMYGMPDGSTAYFASHKDAGGNPRRYGLQVFGSKGVLELIEGTLPEVKFLGDPNWSPGRSRAKWQSVSSAGIGKPEPLEGAKYRARHTLAIEDLIDAIENDRPPICNAIEARGATEMIAAVFESHRCGGPVKMPLENRKNPLTML